MYTRSQFIVGSQSKNLEAGSKTKDTEECCLIPSYDLLSLLSCIILDYLPRGGTIYSELGLPTFIINQKNALQIYL